MQDSKRFQKRVEDFVCEHCGNHVKGGGYTNHCPRCLWSKHVDVNPGDRQEACGGQMEPIAVEGASPDYVLIHRCIRCGREKKNKVSPLDDTEVLITLSRQSAPA